MSYYKTKTFTAVYRLDNMKDVMVDQEFEVNDFLFTSREDIHSPQLTRTSILLSPDQIMTTVTVLYKHSETQEHTPTGAG